MLDLRIQFRWKMHGSCSHLNNLRLLSKRDRAEEVGTEDEKTERYAQNLYSLCSTSCVHWVNIKDMYRTLPEMFLNKQTKTGDVVFMYIVLSSTSWIFFFPSKKYWSASWIVFVSFKEALFYFMDSLRFFQMRIGLLYGYSSFPSKKYWSISWIFLVSFKRALVISLTLT